ncbi:MAG: hypothetical protein ACI8S6_001685 [Myxococcota bacterium]|jgi:hypothetical protein
MLLLLALAAHGAGHGELLVWDVRFAGLVGGQAKAGVTDAPDGAYYVDAWLKNADWYSAIYTIDDHSRSTWTPEGGSIRYETRFREGGFEQDQDMRMSADAFSVWRHQKLKDGWREWTTPYDPHPYVEDPVTAIFALRGLEGEGPWSVPVFSGEATWPLEVTVHGREHMDDTPLGAVDVVIYSLQSRHRGEWEQRGRFLVYLTDDTRHIPVRFVIKSTIGAIRADLTTYTPPQDVSHEAPAP